MIGQAETIIEVFVLGIGLVFLVAGLTLWRTPEHRKRGRAIALFSCVFLLVVGSLFSVAWSHRRQLQSLSPAQVVQIRIASQTITDRPRIEQIVAALHHIEAFSPDHEDDPDVPLTIFLTDGDRYKLRIKYRKATYGDGIVLQFTASDPTLNAFNQGYAFSRELLPIVRELGIAPHP